MLYRPEDVFLSYLPLAHIFDRVAEELFLAISARIGYWQGNAKALMDDVGALRPTIFVGVPRIFDRIYSGVTGKVPLSLIHALSEYARVIASLMALYHLH